MLHKANMTLSVTTIVQLRKLQLRLIFVYFLEVKGISKINSLSEISLTSNVVQIVGEIRTAFNSAPSNRVVAYKVSGRHSVKIGTFTSHSVK